MLMGTWTRHIDHFERKYDKAFARDPFFGAHLMDLIHKRVQVLLHSCNTTTTEDMELGPLEEFGGDPEEGKEGGVFNFNSGMGRLASTEGGGTP